MNNNLIGLNDLLFEQLKQLSDRKLVGEELKQERQRAQSVANVAQVIVKNADLLLRAHKFKDDAMDADLMLPEVLGE